ncbi:uncharacterized protein LOC108212487 [Daucus carota subsp. sativus]|uniref:uncharacterized protein LOC108212487 n=1 Tax=Daucus carota subsp. sativus TaxID=79200 RepID=UPI0007EF4391|nr:PREDICTED: uncharacterized protein LOC108212487 [Daucus carota subsp. sativus]
MSHDQSSAKSWHLFTSEDMIQGYKPKSVRKRKNSAEKENIRGNSNKRFTYPFSPLTPTSLESVISNCNQEGRQSIVSPTDLSKRSSVYKTPEDGLLASRTPLSNITNRLEDSSTIKGGRPYSGLSKFKAPETSRTLFAEDDHPSVDKQKYLRDDDIECSTVPDPFFSDSSDSDYLSGYSSTDDEYIPGMELDSDSDTEQRLNSAKEKPVPEEYVSLGAPEAICSKCNARLWKEERTNKNVTKGIPIFSICCKKGNVVLPPTPPTPSYLMHLYSDKECGPEFNRSIRLYNAMFAFTSSGGNVDHSINNGRGPYIYRLNGQNHHVFGQLIPDDGKEPAYCQLYIYDTTNEVNNRLRWVNVADQQSVDTDVIEGLIQMLDQTNELVAKFRTARDRWESNDLVDLKVELKICRSQSGRENHISTSDEVAGIMVASCGNTTAERDIIVEKKFGGLQRISYIHPKLMSLQYPLLFPNGEDGYHNRIPFQNAEVGSSKEKDMISMKDYYSYRFQVRDNEGLTPRLGGRLYQQYMVDAFSSIEQTRLWWFRTHQTVLRNELYTHICDSIRNGDAQSSNVGKGVILPAGYVGSKRYMQQNFQDALAVCRHVGHPDVFLTMTCNSWWDEIQKMMPYVPGCIPSNCPDIISRVFRLKLEQLTNDIKKKSHFGKCVGVMYVVEFQKRGLPHVHMLVWLDGPSKKFLKENVDKFVSAEIPDPDIDPLGYAAVKGYMMHGPCGLQNPKSPCMKNFKCIRHFPKKYCPKTVFDDSGFPLYMRRKQKITVHVHKADLDNQWVVPYNRDLLGHDTATVEITGRRRRHNNHAADQPIDEIQAYFDGRYVCGAEAAYRIFGFPIHHRTLSVERLPFHLPDLKNCTFHANEPLERVVEREKERASKLEAFFILNKSDPTARKHTYDEIPQHFVWNDGLRRWTPRKRGMQIGRLSYTHHSSGEVWYLRMLLTKVRGPTSFEDLRTVDGVLLPSFREACKEYGLLDDDKEWHDVLNQCSIGGLPPQIRQLFVHIIVNCKVTDIASLWNNHWKQMVDDILLQRRLLSENLHLQLNDLQLQFYALAEIDDLLRAIGKSLKTYVQLPQPPLSYLHHGTNNLIIEETNYNLAEMKAEHEDLLSKCNQEQLNVYNQVLSSVHSNRGGLFFVYGSGGCGKTFLWRTLIAKLRSEGEIVLPVASSGIAATLLPGGRTAHSRFKIPIVLDDFSLCNIGLNTDIAELIRQTKLIIWDEAPMQHRYAFECLDRSLKDIMKVVDPVRGTLPFGGITVVLGGDFRQILPVIAQGDRAEIVSACVTRSRLWSICTIFLLTKNMRLNQGKSQEEIDDLIKFAQWVLDAGDGKLSSPDKSIFPNAKEDDIFVPAQFCDVDKVNTVENMISSTFPDFAERGSDPKYLSERAILTPTNQTVTHLNALIVEKLPGISVSYFSVDSAEDFGGTEAEMNSAFPIEYLNSINVPGMPPHDLKLKVGVVVMLMRNLNQTLGLCNGTRMIITKCLKFCVECEVICGSFVGTKHFIPRMELCPSDTRMPYKLIRKQLPLQVCYAMTINKSQGQSLDKVGLFLPKSVFTHGQFYVAVSRVTSPQGLKIFIDNDSGEPTNVTQNVVYKEIFYQLPKM